MNENNDKITAMPSLTVTSFEQLQAYARGQVVSLPPFAEGQPFVARLQRPSMLALAKSGKIPNALLTSANSLFEGGIQGALTMLDEEALKSIFDVIDVICEASFIEPTYQQIKDSGLELTDEQMMFIFSYSQNGVRQLDSFRQQ